MMKIVVDYTGRFRPIVALPWVMGELQAEVRQLLPQNIFTITRDQVRLIPEVSTDGWSADRNRLNN